MTTASHARGISGPVSATAELARRVPALYTGSLKDVLDRRGHVQQTLPPERLPLGRGTRLASRRSCAGAVIDGARATPSTSWARTPGLLAPRHAAGLPPTLGAARPRRRDDCRGGVRVAPGEWIVGDRDGLVIVPRGDLHTRCSPRIRARSSPRTRSATPSAAARSGWTPTKPSDWRR